MITKIRQRNLEVEDVFGINIIAGTSDIVLGFKSPGRAKRSGDIYAYRLDSYDSTGSSLSGSISVRLSLNGSNIGTVDLSSASTVYDTVLASFTSTSIAKEDLIKYEVLSNVGIKNLVITIYIK
jgi:hypothetical protein